MNLLRRVSKRNKRAKSLDLPPTSVRSAVLVWKNIWFLSILIKRFLEQNHIWNFDDVWEDAIGTKLIKRALQEDRATRGIMEIFELIKKQASAILVDFYHLFQHKIRPMGFMRYHNELIYVLRSAHKSPELQGLILKVAKKLKTELKGWTWTLCK